MVLQFARRWFAPPAIKPDLGVCRAAAVAESALGCPRRPRQQADCLRSRVGVPRLRSGGTEFAIVSVREEHGGRAGQRLPGRRPQRLHGFAVPVTPAACNNGSARFWRRPRPPSTPRRSGARSAACSTCLENAVPCEGRRPRVARPQPYRQARRGILPVSRRRTGVDRAVVVDCRGQRAQPAQRVQRHLHDQPETLSPALAAASGPPRPSLARRAGGDGHGRRDVPRLLRAGALCRRSTKALFGEAPSQTLHRTRTEHNARAGSGVSFRRLCRSHDMVLDRELYELCRGADA